MNTSVLESNAFSGGFDWERQPQAEQLVQKLSDRFLESNRFAAGVANRMLMETGTRFADWVDHFCLPADAHLGGGEGESMQELLQSVGYQRQESDGHGMEENSSEQWYVNPLGLFPAIVLSSESTTRATIKLDNVRDFVFANRLSGVEIEGRSGGRFRRACVSQESSTEFWVCERHGWNGWQIPTDSHESLLVAENTLEQFQLREREFENDLVGFQRVEAMVADAVQTLGVDWTCDLFFEAERRYWQLRNRAAREQYARQQKLGLGWGNHDHHTYRSSRQHFSDLIRVFEQLGFHCRERFYAGADAGWGAQVLEQSRTGIIIFADVDLTPEELAGDFAHDGLSEQAQLGTVGLWCQIHGEAFLQAGMHHLECQFDFSAAREQLSELGCPSMDPFTDFEFLKQSFTVGERWAVIPHRVHEAVQRGWIEEAEAERFIAEGAIGSHLEILERNEGFKGFNQTGVSDIILKTDPRKL